MMRGQKNIKPYKIFDIDKYSMFSELITRLISWYCSIIYLEGSSSRLRICRQYIFLSFRRPKNKSIEYRESR
jgi:hypothetical protein